MRPVSWGAPPVSVGVGKRIEVRQVQGGGDQTGRTGRRAGVVGSGRHGSGRGAGVRHGAGRIIAGNGGSRPVRAGRDRVGGRIDRPGILRQRGQNVSQNQGGRHNKSATPYDLRSIFIPDDQTKLPCVSRGVFIYIFKYGSTRCRTIVLARCSRVLTASSVRPVTSAISL